MRVLWITNVPIGVLGEKIYGKRFNGLWMSSLLVDFEKNKEYKLVVATSIPRKETVKLEENGIVYYGIPNQFPLLYDENNYRNIAAWENMLEREKPDVIQIWGTEFTHGLCALRIANKLHIPSVIYMQGYLGSIARHYLAGLSHGELKKNVTFRDFIKRDSIEQQQKKYYQSVEKEKEMIRLSENVICENDWCENSIRAIVSDISVYRCPLSINHIFNKHIWTISNVEPHSIICTASGYPLKGLHMVLRAVALLKKDYPDIKLYVPGTKMVSDGSLQWTIRKNGYTKYIEQLIRKLDIQDQIVWMGYVSQEQLAVQYKKTRVFVMSSSIENHSSSLKEAMMVGTPSVASAVGGVMEYVHQGENGFIYRFEEYEIMAAYVRRLFEDDELAVRLSEQCRKDMRKLHESTDIYKRITNIYRNVVKDND